MRRANIIRAWAGLGHHIIDLNGLGPGWALSPWAWAGPGWGLLSPWRTLAVTESAESVSKISRKEPYTIRYGAPGLLRAPDLWRPRGRWGRHGCWGRGGCWCYRKRTEPSRAPRVRKVPPNYRGRCHMYYTLQDVGGVCWTIWECRVTEGGMRVRVFRKIKVRDICWAEFWISSTTREYCTIFSCEFSIPCLTHLSFAYVIAITEHQERTSSGRIPSWSVYVRHQCPKKLSIWMWDTLSTIANNFHS